MNKNVSLESLPKPTYDEPEISKGAISFSSMEEQVKTIILRSVWNRVTCTCTRSNGYS